MKRGPVPGADLLTQWPEPEPGPGEVLVRVAATSICGTDRHLHDWTPAMAALQPGFPFVLGHETAGTVVAVGAGASRFERGDRVASESHLFCGECRLCLSGRAHNCERLRVLGVTADGAFAELFTAPERCLYPLPEELPLELGALLEPVGVSVNAARTAGELGGRSVLVSGCGPIGHVVVKLALLGGASRVVALEPNPHRRRLAAELGAEVLDPLSEPVPGGFDVAVETSAVASMTPVLLSSLRKEATLVTVGPPPAAVEVDLSRTFIFGGVTWKGVYGRRVWETWDEVVSLAASGELDLGALVSHRLRLEDFERGLELLSGEAQKVLLLP